MVPQGISPLWFWEPCAEQGRKAIVREELSDLEKMIKTSQQALLGLGQFSSLVSRWLSTQSFCLSGMRQRDLPSPFESLFPGYISSIQGVLLTRTSKDISSHIIWKNLSYLCSGMWDYKQCPDNLNFIYKMGKRGCFMVMEKSLKTSQWGLLNFKI